MSDGGGSPGLTAVRGRAADGRVVVHIHDAATGEHYETLTGHEAMVAQDLATRHPGLPVEDIYQTAS